MPARATPLVAGAIVAEFGAALWMLQRQNRVRSPSPLGYEAQGAIEAIGQPAS